MTIISRTRAIGLNICDKNNSVDLSEGNLVSNGDVYLNGTTYKQNERYYDNATGLERGCICNKMLCVRKCCAIGYAYHRNRTCVKINETFYLPMGDGYEVHKNANPTDLFHFILGKPICNRPKFNYRVGQRTNNIHMRLVSNLLIITTNK